MLRSLDKAIIISVLLVTSIFSIKFSFFDFYSSDNYGSLEIRPVFGDDPINPDVSTSGEGTDAQPSTEEDDQSTDPSSNEVTDPSSNEVTDPSSNEVTDPSSNEVTDPSSNAPGGSSDPSNGCDLSSANPTETGGPGCVDVEPGTGDGPDFVASKKKKHPILVPSPCLKPCANNTAGNGPVGDNDPPPNETVSPSDCDNGQPFSLAAGGFQGGPGIFQGAFGACNGGLTPLTASLLSSFLGIPAGGLTNTAPLTSSKHLTEKSNMLSSSQNNAAFGADGTEVTVRESCDDGIDNDHNGVIDNQDPLCISSKLPEEKFINFNYDKQGNGSGISRITLHDYQISKLSNNISNINATTFENQPVFLKLNNTNIK
jgi:hypothetical protein